MHKPYRHIPTAEERCIVRAWTWRVLIIYGAFVLTAFGVVSLGQNFGQGFQRSDRRRCKGSNVRQQLADR
jgi:hypothetical protein